MGDNSGLLAVMLYIFIPMVLILILVVGVDSGNEGLIAFVQIMFGIIVGSLIVNMGIITWRK